MAYINATIPLTSDTTNGELIAQLQRFPLDSKVKAAVTKGDRPGDSDVYRVELRWTD